MPGVKSLYVAKIKTNYNLITVMLYQLFHIFSLKIIGS